MISLLAISAVSAADNDTDVCVGLENSDDCVKLSEENTDDSKAFIDAPSVIYYTEKADFDEYPYDCDVTYGSENDFAGNFTVFDKNNKIIYNEGLKGSDIQKTHSFFYLITKNSNKLTLGKYTLQMKDSNGTICTSKVVNVEKSLTKIRFPTIKETTEYYSVTHTRYIQDEFGDSVKGATGTVKITVNGKTFSAKVKDSYYKITIILPKKSNTYNCKITYSGDSKYKGSSSNFKMIISKPVPKLLAYSKSYKVKSTKLYSVTLKNSDNKAMKNAQVYLQVNGKKFTAKTNSVGKATFKITNLNKKGSFNAEVKFSGNGSYASVTKKVKITLK